jgi:hypothetical protein
MANVHPERNAEICRLRGEGLWPTEIAKRLGVSRNTVIGVCFRAGLNSSDVDRSAIAQRFTPRGEAHGKSKLTWSEVADIRQAYVPWSREFGRAALARRYSVSTEAIAAILSRRTWVDA